MKPCRSHSWWPRSGPHPRQPQSRRGLRWTRPGPRRCRTSGSRSEEHTSELQSHSDLHSFPTRRSSDLALLVAALWTAPTPAAEPPRFEVDASWPKTLPNKWIMGQAAGVAVDAQDHVWVVQRPKTLTDDEKAASFDPPRTKCCVPAPPVLEFDQEGNLVQAWGGSGQGYDWPQNEHGI